MRNLIIFLLLFSTKSQAFVAESQTDELNCLQLESIKASSDSAFALIDSISNKMLKLECRTLRIGEERAIDVDHDNSPSGIEHKYALKRVKEKEYKATLNLEFFDAKKSTILNGPYQKKLEACLPLMNTKLIGPNGEKLTIDLYKKGQGLEPPKVKIGISNISRSHSAEYSKDASCDTIIHELMHLLGLVDEYKEQVETYDCRSLGPDNSVMTKALEAFMETFPPIHTCECNTANCREILAKGYKGKKCPEGSEEGSPIWHAAKFSRANFEEYKIMNKNVERISQIYKNGSAREGNKYYYSDDAGKASLLLPAQFNVIVHPGCARNIKYYHCALDAYSASKSAGGSGCVWETKADYCKNNDWLMK